MTDTTEQIDDDVQPANEPRKPDLRERITEMIENRLLAGCHYPQCWPEDHSKAPDWWIKFLEPPMPYEQDMRTKRGWRLPYQDRVLDCLKIWFKLDNATQHELTRMRQSHVYWRGDSIEFMRKRAKIKPQDISKSDVRKSIYAAMQRLGA